jgi:hypothetical protein
MRSLPRFLLFAVAVAVPSVFCLALIPFHPAEAWSGSARLASPDDRCTKAGQFCVNRETSSHVCRVQEATERPQHGPSLAGPFGSRAEGNAAMCGLYEPASEDAAKCGAVLPDGLCDAK